MFRKLLSSAAAIAVLGLLGLSQIASADDCCGGCCKTGCVSVPETKKVASRCYSSSCEEFCVPKCSPSCLISGLFKGWWPNKDYCACNACASCESNCDSCDQCNGCGSPRTRKDLVIKIKIHEEQGHQCVPGCRETSGCCNSGCSAVPATVVPAAPKGEMIPAPKAPEGKGASEVLMIDEGNPGVAHTMPR